MNDVLKAILALVGAVVLIGILFILGIVFRFINLKTESYFAPKEQTVQRNVFEQTKSYVHGAIQDIAKYYEEYNKAKSEDEKQVIANVIKQRFAEFDANNINSFQLRQWFINIRGY